MNELNLFWKNIRDTTFFSKLKILWQTFCKITDLTRTLELCPSIKFVSMQTLLNTIRLWRQRIMIFNQLKKKLSRTRNEILQFNTLPHFNWEKKLHQFACQAIECTRWEEKDELVTNTHILQ